MNSMPYYLSYSAGYPRSFEEFVRFAVDLGFAGVELIPDLSPNLVEQLTQERTQWLVEFGRENGLAYTVHNVFMDINPTSLVPRVRDLALDITAKCIHFAFQIGAKAFIFHTGYQFGAWRSKPEQAQMYRQVEIGAYQNIANLGRNYGIKTLVENGSYYLSSLRGARTPLHTGITYQDLVRIILSTNSQYMGICFDVGKAYMSSEAPTQSSVIDFVGEVYPWIGELHLNTFPDYEIIIPPVLSYLKTRNFQGPLVFECSTESIEPLQKLLKGEFLS